MPSSMTICDASCPFRLSLFAESLGSVSAEALSECDDLNGKLCMSRNVVLPHGWNAGSLYFICWTVAKP